jgi:hypothetical protein
MNMELPSLRNNIATFAVPVEQIPAVVAVIRQSFSAEDYDAAFAGQELQTTYFDTRGLALRRHRLKRDKYITLRVRCYRAEAGDSYALSAKTEQEKFRMEIDGATADLLTGRDNIGPAFARLLPLHLFARLLEIAGEEGVGPVVRVGCRRYACEDERDRLTLDVGIRTDTGKRLSYAVCEFKSTRADEPVPPALTRLPIRPMKLSKFLWALEV